MKRLITTSTERVAFRVLGAVAMVALAILTWGFFKTQSEQHDQQIAIREQQDRIEKQNVRLAEQDRKIAATVLLNCQANRKLISDIALRTVGATYAEYKMNPRKAVEKYRAQLIQLALYRDNEELLDQVIQRTQQTLSDADPEKCKQASKEAGVDTP